VGLVRFWPGGDLPAGLVAVGDVVLTAAGEEPRLGDGDRFGDGDGDGMSAGAGAGREGAAVAAPAAPVVARAWLALTGAHGMNGALGPPSSPTAATARQMIRTAAAQIPARRIRRRRRPDRSAKTGVWVDAGFPAGDHRCPRSG
jgi:hypothetical protein